VRLLPERGAAPVRPDRPQRDAEQGAGDLPPAPGRRRHRHRRQLPRRGAVVEDRAGARHRQHDRLEAQRGRARRRLRLRQAHRGGRRPGGRRQPRVRRWQGRRGPAPDRNDGRGPRAQVRLHRLHRRRSGGRRDRGPQPAAPHPRARREESAGDPPRRGPRQRRARRPVQRLRDRRAALHERGEHPHRRADLRRLQGTLPRRGARREDRRPGRPRGRPVRAVHQPPLLRTLGRSTTPGRRRTAPRSCTARAASPKATPPPGGWATRRPRTTAGRPSGRA